MNPRPNATGAEPNFGVIEASLLVFTLVVSVLATSADYEEIERAMKLYPTQANHDRNWRKIAEQQRLEPPQTWLRRQSLTITKVVDHSSVVLVVATIGVAVSMFARSQAWRRRSNRGAGVIAVASVTPWLIISVFNEFLFRRFPEEGWGYVATFKIWSGIAEPIGGAIVALWFLLWIGRAWRAEPNWRDRLGRTLAFAWLAHAIVLNGIPHY